MEGHTMNWEPDNASMHSPAWVMFTQLNFALTTAALGIAVWAMPVDSWIRAFMGLGLVALIGATITMSKTIRDVHEGTKVTTKVENAKVERLLLDTDPLTEPPAPTPQLTDHPPM